MSKSTTIIGISDLDGKFSAMIKVKLACEDAEVDYPQDVIDYFDHNMESSVDELRIEMAEVDIESAIRTEKNKEEEKFIVDLSKLPDGVTSIIFSNSW